MTLKNHFKAWLFASMITIATGIIADWNNKTIRFYEFVSIELLGYFCYQIIFAIEDLKEK